MRQRTIDVYRVIKPITVNSESICQIGDILIVDEDSLDGASCMNLTQAWGFQPFCQYENVINIDKKNWTWEQYMAVYHGCKQVQTDFCNQYKEKPKTNIVKHDFIEVLCPNYHEGETFIKTKVNLAKAGCLNQKCVNYLCPLNNS